jgi:hypothetical protein
MYPKVLLKGSIHQPLDGGQLGNSLKGSLIGKDPLRQPQFNPYVGSFRWLAFDPHMFIPPWY